MVCVRSHYSMPSRSYLHKIEDKLFFMLRKQAPIAIAQIMIARASILPGNHGVDHEFLGDRVRELLGDGRRNSRAQSLCRHITVRRRRGIRLK